MYSHACRCSASSPEPPNVPESSPHAPLSAGPHQPCSPSAASQPAGTATAAPGTATATPGTAATAAAAAAVNTAAALSYDAILPTLDAGTQLCLPVTLLLSCLQPCKVFVDVRVCMCVCVCFFWMMGRCAQSCLSCLLKRKLAFQQARECRDECTCSLR